MSLSKRPGSVRIGNEPPLWNPRPGDPSSIGGLNRELGVGSVEFMVAFLPLELEARMVKIELAYQNAKSEDEIQSTIFRCVSRGGGFDVVVVDQTLRN